MAKDHFIPASLIARFSQELSGPARKRKVWTLRHDGGRALVRAEVIGYSNRLYDVDEIMFPTRGWHAIDQVWHSYEPDLPETLDRLIDGSTTAAEWVDTLVPFVAAAFGRDRGDEERLRARLSEELAGPRTDEADPFADMAFDRTNLTINRVREMERFAARALACEWVVHEVSGDLVVPTSGTGSSSSTSIPTSSPCCSRSGRGMSSCSRLAPLAGS